MGATSLLTTVEDLAAWDRNFEEGTVGGAAMLDQLHERGRLTSGKELSYAFGLEHGEYRGQPIVHHSGGDAGYRSYFARFPEKRFSIACLCNVSAAGPATMARRVADVYLKDELRPVETKAEETEKVRLSEEQLASRIGLYWRRAKDELLEFAVKEGELVLVQDEEQTKEMQPIDENRFRIDPWQVEFHFDSNVSGTSPGVKLVVSGEEAQVFERVDRSHPSPEELRAYVGSYVSDEIEAVYRIVSEDGALILKRLRHEPIRMRPAMRDVFVTPSWTVRFQRDSQNRVSGMVLNSERVRNFKLSRSGS